MATILFVLQHVVSERVCMCV